MKPQSKKKELEEDDGIVVIVGTAIGVVMGIPVGGHPPGIVVVYTSESFQTYVPLPSSMIY